MNHALVDEVRTRVGEYLVAGLFLLVLALKEHSLLAYFIFAFVGFDLLIIFGYIWYLLNPMPRNWLDNAHKMLVYVLYIVAIGSSAIEIQQAEIVTIYKTLLYILVGGIFFFFYILEMILAIVTTIRGGGGKLLQLFSSG